MINISALAHIGIRVANFKHAIHFYKQLGFSVIRDDKHERVVVLKHAGGIEINLLDSVNSKNYKQNILMDVPTRYAGYTHMALRVADIQKSANAIRLLGIEITEGPLKFGDGSTSIFFRDPDKNVIELSQALRHFKSFTGNTKNIQKESEL